MPSRHKRFKKCHITETFFHQPLESGGSIAEALRHLIELKKAKWTPQYNAVLSSSSPLPSLSDSTRFQPGPHRLISANYEKTISYCCS